MSYDELKARVERLEKRERVSFERRWNDGGFKDSDFIPSGMLETMRRVLTEHEDYLDGCKEKTA